ncbi:unnamed protein product, partial [marine sediment metagenome]
MDLIPTKYWLTVAKRAVCGAVAFAVVFTQVFTASALAATIDPADPPNEPEVLYDLIAIVVDTELDKDSSSYEGLRNQYVDELDNFSAKVDGRTITLSGLTISERVIR